MNRIVPNLFLACVCSFAAAAQNPRVHVTREHLSLDAKLNEAAWQQADSISDFRQREPMEGDAASERTVVRFLSAPDGLWIGIHAYDREPSRVLHAQLRRDTELNTDDAVQVMLSPLQDKRTGFLFAVNPNGAVTDAEIVSFESENRDWDAVWDARAQVTDDGWVAEMFIPWQTLRYRESNSAWDVNLRRVVRRKNEDVLWKAWHRTESIRFLEKAGIVDGFVNLPPRATAEIRPYMAATGSSTAREYATDGSFVPSASAGLKGALGVDAKFAPSRGLTLDLTTNADFAQAEVDRQVINFSRFPLFLPERRPFFTEGAGIFDFGRRQETQLFYSRRIGLDADGTPIPLQAGARLSGRIGDQQVGVIAARTGGDKPATDAVVRVRRDLLGRGYLGAMFTGREERGSDATTSGGLDMNVPFVVKGQNLVFMAATAWTHDSTGGTPNYSRFVVDFPNDFADIVSRVERVEAGFNPTLGFVQTDGIVRWAGQVSFMPRPHIPYVRRLEFTLLDYNYVQNISGGRMSNAEFGIKPLGVRFNSGDELAVRLSRSGDAPTIPFAIAGTTFQPGNYWFDQAHFSYEGSSRRAVKFDAKIDVGDYYLGSGVAYTFGLEGRLQPHLLWSTNFNYVDVKFTTSRLLARTATSRVDYALTPRLNTTLFAQWNNDVNRAALNARVRWTRTPGSDLYVVLNSAWPTDIDGHSIPWGQPARGGVVVKYVQYLRY